MVCLNEPMVLMDAAVLDEPALLTSQCTAVTDGLVVVP
jgi:hypothetical protein